jgi:hypothetical protein
LQIGRRERYRRQMKGNEGSQQEHASFYDGRGAAGVEHLPDHTALR